MRNISIMLLAELGDTGGVLLLGEHLAEVFADRLTSPRLAEIHGKLALLAHVREPADEARLLHDVADLVTRRFACMIAIADDPATAIVLSYTAWESRIVPPGPEAHAAALAPVRISLVSPLVAQILYPTGVLTFGALAALPAEEIVRRFGQGDVLLLHEVARGRGQAASLAAHAAQDQRPAAANRRPTPPAPPPARAPAGTVLTFRPRERARAPADAPAGELVDLRR